MSLKKKIGLGLLGLAATLLLTGCSVPGQTAEGGPGLTAVPKVTATVQPTPSDTYSQIGNDLDKVQQQVGDLDKLNSSINDGLNDKPQDLVNY